MRQFGNFGRASCAMSPDCVVREVYLLDENNKASARRDSGL